MRTLTVAYLLIGLLLTAAAWHRVDGREDFDDAPTVGKTRALLAALAIAAVWPAFLFAGVMRTRHRKP